MSISVLERKLLDRHSHEFLAILTGEVEPMWTQQLVRGPIVADQVDEEGPEQILVDSFIGVEEMDVEQVARVLAIKRRCNLAGIKVGKRTTCISAKPNLSSTAGLTDRSSGLKTVPRRTGDPARHNVQPSSVRRLFRIDISNRLRPGDCQ